MSNHVTKTILETRQFKTFLTLKPHTYRLQWSSSKSNKLLSPCVYRAANWVQTLTHILFLQSELSMLAVRVYSLLTLNQQLNICWNRISYLAVKTLYGVKRSEFYNTIAVFMLKVGAWVPHKATNKWVKSRKKILFVFIAKADIKNSCHGESWAFISTSFSHPLFLSISHTNTSMHKFSSKKA